MFTWVKQEPHVPKGGLFFFQRLLSCQEQKGLAEGLVVKVPHEDGRSFKLLDKVPDLPHRAKLGNLEESQMRHKEMDGDLEVWQKIKQSFKNPEMKATRGEGSQTSKPGN